MSVMTKPAASAEAPDTSDLGTVARLGAQKSKFKAAAKRLLEERDAQTAKVTELEAKVAGLEKSGGAEKIAELEAKLRETGHRSKFNELAKAANVDDKAFGDLWEKSGYKAEGDAPDEAKIKAAIESQRTERPFLFKPAAQAGEQQLEQPQIVPGPGRGQGGTAPNTTGPFGVTQQQLRDPAWCFANQAAIASASKGAMTLPTSQVASKLAIL